MKKFLQSFTTNIIDSTISLLVEQINQYAKMIILVGDLLELEKDEKIKHHYEEVFKDVYKEYKATANRLKESLEAYFEYEKEENIECRMVYKKLYKEIIKII